MPPTDEPNGGLTLSSLNPLPDSFFEEFAAGGSNIDITSVKEMIRLMDLAIDRRLRISCGGEGSTAMFNQYRHTLYGMPTSTNKNTMSAARARYKNIKKAHPNWENNAWNVGYSSPHFAS